MDDRQFDALARGIERRGLLRAVVFAAGLGPFAVRILDAQAGPSGLGFCEATPKDGRCRKGGQCCSGSCQKKKRKRKGKCRCSPLQARCSSDNDCCPPAVVNAVTPECISHRGALQRTCCMVVPGHCREDADCCGFAVCRDLGDGLKCAVEM